MPKKFYTERDIEDLVNRGVLSLELTDEVVLTELAYEKAERLGMKLVKETGQRPAAPVRPYISAQNQPKPAASSTPVTTGSGTMSAGKSPDLHQRIKDAVVARLGGQVDPVLLDTIIKRVLNNISTR